jgi:ribosomal protein S9
MKPPYQNVVQSTSSKRNSLGKKTVINFYKGQILSSGAHFKQGDETDVYKNQVSETIIQKSSTGFKLEREDQESSPLKGGGFSSQMNAVQSLRLIRAKAPDSRLNEQESMTSIV